VKILEWRRALIKALQAQAKSLTSSRHSVNENYLRKENNFGRPKLTPKQKND